MVTAIDAPALKRCLRDGEEIALIDTREEGAFAARHLLLAVCIPLSRLELHAASLVPRKSTRIVVCDGGEGVAGRAAATLASHGYRDVRVLDGGVDAWEAAGYETFSGVNVPSKAFGEIVETSLGTPHIAPRDLKRRLEAGDDIVVLDSRPLEEYRRMSIPHGVDCPGGELVYRAKTLVRSPRTTVVVNCAGRTRSIIGAQSLIDAGLEHPVIALENGTMGWHLAGLDLEHGKTEHAPEPGPEIAAWARAAAAKVADKHGVRALDPAALDALRDDPERTLYLLDVRTPQEFEQGHLPGSVSAPGGQLVQATDEYAAVRNARFVMIDADGVRARMTGAWLRRMGEDDVYVYDLRAAAPASLERGPVAAPCLGIEAIRPDTLAVADLERELACGEALLIDLAESPEFARGHIPGAWFAIRSRLGISLPRMLREQRGARTIVLTSPDGVLARLAWPEVRVLAGIGSRPDDDGGAHRVAVLEGGTRAWTAAGHALREGEDRRADEGDVWLRPYERPGAPPSAMDEYLKWEVALVPKVARDGDTRFRP